MFCFPRNVALLSNLVRQLAVASIGARPGQAAASAKEAAKSDGL
jgi:hypothetical protein